MANKINIIESIKNFLTSNITIPVYMRIILFILGIVLVIIAIKVKNKIEEVTEKRIKEEMSNSIPNYLPDYVYIPSYLIAVPSLPNRKSPYIQKLCKNGAGFLLYSDYRAIIKNFYNMNYATAYIYHKFRSSAEERKFVVNKSKLESYDHVMSVSEIWLNDFFEIANNANDYLIKNVEIDRSIIYNFNDPLADEIKEFRKEAYRLIKANENSKVHTIKINGCNLRLITNFTEPTVISVRKKDITVENTEDTGI